MAQSDPKLLYAVFKRHLVNGFGINMTEKCVFNGSQYRGCPSTSNQMKSLPSWSDKTLSVCTPHSGMPQAAPYGMKIDDASVFVSSCLSCLCSLCAVNKSQKCLEWNVFCKIRTNLHLICPNRGRGSACFLPPCFPQCATRRMRNK